MTCTAPSSAPTKSRSPEGLSEALRGVALPAREMSEGESVVRSNAMMKGNLAIAEPDPVSPSTYAFEPVGERKNCVGVKLPVPRLTAGATVLSIVRKPRGAGQPGTPTAGKPLIAAVTVCTLGGASASADWPSGRARMRSLAIATPPIDPGAGSSQVGRNAVPAGSLPAMYPSVPLPMKVTSVAGALNGTNLGASTLEKTSKHPGEPASGQGWPDTTYALNPPAMLSGENAAAVAPSNKKVETFCVVLLLQPWQIKTRFGESVVWEKTTVPPSGEVASTLPATLETCYTAQPANTMAAWLPKERESTPK